MFKKNKDVYDFQDPRDPAQHSFSILHILCRISMMIGAIITFARNLVANILFLGLVLVCIVAYNLSDDIENSAVVISGGDQNPLEIAKGPVLWLDLNVDLDDLPLPEDRISQLFMNFSSELSKARTLSVNDVIAALNAAADDPDLKTVVADMSEMNVASVQSVERIVRAFDEFKKKSGGEKKLIVFSSYFDQASYVAASHADEIVLDPMGGIGLRGISMNSLYYGPLLERFKLTPYVFKAGSHKSAVEPMLYDAMSPEVKKEYEHLATSLWSEVEKLVKTGRPQIKGPLLPAPDLYIEKLREAKGDSARFALNYGLCDSLMTFDELKKQLAALYPSRDDPKSPEITDGNDYIQYLKASKQNQRSAPGIAVIYGTGTISPYTESSRSFSAENFELLTDAVLKDKNNKGVLIYLDSGGGEVIASEEIRRLIKSMSENGLKTAVYMADMTASGAYWAASAASHIYASPTTLTGSIGVFATSIGAHRLLNEYGVTQDGVSTSPLAESPVAKAMDPNVQKIAELEVGNIYDRFINLVASSRGLDVKNAPIFAEGRVFTAQDAKKLGLIDEITSFDEALDALKAECDLKDEEGVVRFITVPVGSPAGLIPKLLISNFGSFMPEGALKLLVRDVAAAKKEKRPQMLMAVEAARPKL